MSYHLASAHVGSAFCGAVLPRGGVLRCVEWAERAKVTCLACLRRLAFVHAHVQGRVQTPEETQDPVRELELDPPAAAAPSEDGELPDNVIQFPGGER